MEHDGMLLKEHRQQKKFTILRHLFVLTVLVNIVVLPISVFIGAMATDSPGSDFRDFLFGFFLIQLLPLVLFSTVSLVMIFYVRSVKRIDFKRTFFKVMITINIITVPVSLYIGKLGMDFHDGSIMEFIYGFLIVQTVPLLKTLIGHLALKDLTEFSRSLPLQ